MNSNYKDGQGVKHDYGCQCEALQSQLSQVQGELQHTTAVAMSAEARTVKLEAERDSLKAENEILRQAFDDGTHKA